MFTDPSVTGYPPHIAGQYQGVCMRAHAGGLVCGLRKYFMCLCVHSLSIAVVFELLLACIYCINMRVHCILHLVQTL